MTEPLLQVDDLVVHYPAGRKRVVHAVDGVSLTVAPGEFVALVGESGCGKTTTAQAIMRMAKVTAGTITYRGRDITNFSQREMRPIRHEMQLIFQDPYESLDPRFRVRDTVIEPLQIHGVNDNREERVRAALERAGGKAGPSGRATKFFRKRPQVICNPRIVPVAEANLSVSIPMRWSMETKRFGSG